MLTISDFSEISHLPAQTLRLYHSEGLLVPAEVDERSGYRSYTFDQVETAMLVTVLRGTGMSVAAVRHALTHPDAVSALLDEHAEALVRRRRREDEALSDARALVAAAPQVTTWQRGAATVLSALVAGPTPNPRPATSRPSSAVPYDWEWVETATTAAVGTLVQVAGARGFDVAGPAWRAPAVETEQQKRAGLTAAGPHWVVKLPVTTDGRPTSGAVPAGDLPEGVELHHLDPVEELSVFLPGKASMAKHAAALSHLVNQPLVGGYVDLGRVRHVLHADGTQTTVAVVRAREG